MLPNLKNFKISKRIPSLQMLIGKHTVCSLNRLTFSVMGALVVDQHVKHMTKIWCLGVLLCFWVQVHALAMSQFCSRTHLMDTASTSPHLMGRKPGCRGCRSLAV